MNKYLITALALVFLVAPAAASINSADTVNYQSNSDFFNGKVFQMDFTADGSTDTVNVIVPSSDLSSEAGTGSVDADISIDAENTETKAEYSFLNEDGPSINQYQFEDFFVERIKSDFDTEEEYYNYVYNEVDGRCFDGGDNGLSDDIAFKSGVINGFNVDTKVHCVSASKIESVGEISSDPSALFSTDWTISSGSKEVSRTISNGETGDGVSTRVGDDVIIEWKGSIGTGENAPVPTDEKVAYSNSGGYTIIDADDYDAYTDYLGGGTIEDLMVKTMKGQITGAEAQSRLEDAAGDAQDPHPNTEFDSPSYSGTGFSDGSMTLSISNLRYPEFSIYANACEAGSGESCDAFVEIEKPVGAPGNLQVSGDRFNELSSGNVEASFENVGGSEGSFSTRIRSCSEGFTFSGTSQSVSLDAGQSTTVNLPVTFDSSSYKSKEVSGSCTVEVTETSSDATITSTAELTGVQKSECNPGNKFVKTVNGKDEVRQCQSDGLGVETIKTCSTDETAQQTKEGYQCVDDSKPPIVDGGCDKILGFTNPICQIKEALNNLGGGLSIAILMLDLIVGVAAGLIGLFLFGTYGFKAVSVVPVLEDSRVQTGLAITGFVAGLVIGYSLFSQWWIKLLALIGLIAGTYIYAAGKSIIGGLL